MSCSDYEALVAKRDEIMDVVYELNSLNKSKAEAEAEIPKLLNQRETLAPWLGFELPLDYKGTKHTKAFIGTKLFAACICRKGTKCTESRYLHH